MNKSFATEYSIKQKGNGVYVFVIDGDVTITLPTGKAGDQKLNKRDGFGVWDVEKLSIVADNDAEVLLMEVPMD